jgi:hypothetical protein
MVQIFLGQKQTEVQKNPNVLMRTKYTEKHKIVFFQDKKTRLMSHTIGKIIRIT